MSWPLVSLGSVALINPRLPKDSDESQLVTFLGMASISEDGKILEQETRVLSETKKGFTYFERNDVLLAKITPCFENGKAALVSNLEHQIGFGSTEFHVLRAIPEKLDSKYLFYLVWSDQFRFIGENAMKGAAGQKRISSDFLKDFLIPLPPLAEQKRIAAILEKADAVRHKRQQVIKLADAFLSATFLERFGAPEHSPYGSCTLKEVSLKITDGAHFTPTYMNEGIPFLRVTDINKEYINWNNVKYIPENEHQELIKRCHPEKGDVLYSKNGTIGVPKLIDWDLEFSIFVSLCLIKPDPKKLRGKFLFSFLKTPFALKQATSKSKSATVTNLHLVEIKEIKIPIPSLAIQDEWISFFDKFNEFRDALKSSLGKLEDIFNSLSQKAFSGNL